MKEQKIIRKRDPTIKRKNIQVATLNKIKSFLKEQSQSVYKSELVKKLRIDYNSLNLALTMINFKTDSEGKIYLKKRGKNVSVFDQ